MSRRLPVAQTSVPTASSSRRCSRRWRHCRRRGAPARARRCWASASSDSRRWRAFGELQTSSQRRELLLSGFRMYRNHNHGINLNPDSNTNVTFCIVYLLSTSYLSILLSPCESRPLCGSGCSWRPLESWLPIARIPPVSCVICLYSNASIKYKHHVLWILLVDVLAKNVAIYLA